MSYLKPNDARAKNAILFIWIALAIDIVSLVSNYFQYDLLHSASISMEEATSNNARQQFISVISIIIYVFSAITFIQWFRRAYYNLDTKIDHLSFSENWAAAGWFIPFVNLYRPYQIMKELYKETDILLSEKCEKYIDRITTKRLSLWWGIKITIGITSSILANYSREAKTIEQINISTVASMVLIIAGIPLTFITLKVIKEYAAIEPLLYDINKAETYNYNKDI